LSERRYEGEGSQVKRDSELIAYVVDRSRAVRLLANLKEIEEPFEKDQIGS
jgi:hypothetical protein